MSVFGMAKGGCIRACDQVGEHGDERGHTWGRPVRPWTDRVGDPNAVASEVRDHGERAPNPRGRQGRAVTWNGSWNGSPGNPLVLGASRAVSCGIGAGSGSKAWEHGSCKRLPCRIEPYFTCRSRRLRLAGGAVGGVGDDCRPADAEDQRAATEQSRCDRP